MARSRATATNTAAPVALQSLVDAQTANTECLETYSKCMDNYCNVLDADLGRCSCSGDMTQFARVSDALATANTELQDVMKKISYLGLSADEITAMYTQTAGEGVMGTITDTSKIKSDLNAITNMLVNVKKTSAGATGASDNENLGLLNIDLTANNFDINSMLGAINGTKSSPLLNQRGEQLYKSAAARCKSSVLKNCAGADENVVAQRYKTEINRACMEYGNALQKKNDDARRMIDNAGRVLQMARLKVQSDKNAYDLRGCVAALDACMRDDFVCGDDYGHCLDASGQYFVNGELISGATESKIMTDIWGVANPGADKSFITSQAAKGNIASLIQKIGNPIRRDGLCSNVLNKCQKQWRDDKSNTYNSTNNVVLAYLGDVIPKIVMRQRTLINDFRTNCVSTVNACMTKQGTPTGISPRSAQRITSDFLAAQVGACRTTIDACAGVMGMTDKQILAQYIEKNVCDNYSFTYDFCNGDSYCKNVESKCLIPKMQQYYNTGDFSFPVGLGVSLVNDLYRPFIDDCAKTTNVLTCAASLGQNAKGSLINWINKTLKPMQCKAFNPNLANENVCNIKTNESIYTHINKTDLLDSVIQPDSHANWYAFWNFGFTDDYIKYRFCGTAGDYDNKTLLDIPKIINLMKLAGIDGDTAIRELIGYKFESDYGYKFGYTFGYKTFSLTKSTDENPVFADIVPFTYSDTQYKYLPVFVQGSTNIDYRNQIANSYEWFKGCECKLAMPFSDNTEICVSDVLLINFSNPISNCEMLSICPELCAYAIYGNSRINQSNWAMNITTNIQIMHNNSLLRGQPALNYVNSFIKDAFMGKCETGHIISH